MAIHFDETVVRRASALTITVSLARKEMKGRPAFEMSADTILSLLRKITDGQVSLPEDDTYWPPVFKFLVELLRKEWDPDFYARLCGTGSQFDKFLAEWYRGGNTAPAPINVVSDHVLDWIVDGSAEFLGLGGMSTYGRASVSSRLRADSSPLFQHLNAGQDGKDFFLAIYILTKAGAPLAYDTPNIASVFTRLYRQDAVQALKHKADKYLVALFTTDPNDLSDILITSKNGSVENVIASDRIIRF